LVDKKSTRTVVRS